MTAALLLILVAPIVLATKLYRRVVGAPDDGATSAYRDTIECDPLAYDGPRPLVVSLWAPWATVWFAATEGIVRDLQDELAGRCEFAYVEAADRSTTDEYGVDVVPAVLVFHDGREVGRFVNLVEPHALRECVAARVVPPSIR